MTVCKQNQAVVSRKFRQVNISLILFRQIFEIKMPIPRIFYYLILRLSFCLWIVVFSFLGTIHFLKISRKKANIYPIVKSMSSSSEVAVIFNSRKRVST